MNIVRRIVLFFRNLFTKQPKERIVALQKKDLRSFIKSHGIDRMKPSHRHTVVENILKSRRFFS